EHLAELVVRNGDGEPGAAARKIFESAEPDVEVAAGGGGVEAGEADLDELRDAPEAVGQEAGDLDVEADDPRRVTRVRLDEGGTPLRIAAPSELPCVLGMDSDCCAQRRHDHQNVMGSGVIFGGQHLPLVASSVLQK